MIMEGRCYKTVGPPYSLTKIVSRSGTSRAANTLLW